MTHGNRKGITDFATVQRLPGLKRILRGLRKEAQPPTLTICLGSSCFTRGNDENLPRIQEWLRKKGLEGRVALKGSRCEGRCKHGPNLRIGDAFLPDARPGSLLAELEKAL